MRTTTLVIALAGVLVPLAAHAEEVNLGGLEDGQQRVHVTTGMEYGLVAGAGYGRVLTVGDRQLVLTGEATLPWAGADLRDYRVQIGALAPLVGSTHWKLAAAVAPIVRGTANDTGTMTDVGVDLGVIGGYYRPSWFVAGEAGFDASLSTHVSHSDAYRETVYMDAKDGWYANTGGNLRAGLQGGASLGRYDVILRAGQVRDVNGGKPMMPIYGGLTVAARW